jgi:hypothetical protein
VSHETNHAAEAAVPEAAPIIGDAIREMTVADAQSILLSKLDGSLVSSEQWQQFLDRHITPRFPEGLTVIEASGQYLDRWQVILRSRRMSSSFSTQRNAQPPSTNRSSPSWPNTVPSSIRKSSCVPTRSKRRSLLSR